MVDEGTRPRGVSARLPSDATPLCSERRASIGLFERVSEFARTMLLGGSAVNKPLANAATVALVVPALALMVSIEPAAAQDGEVKLKGRVYYVAPKALFNDYGINLFDPIDITARYDTSGISGTGYEGVLAEELLLQVAGLDQTEMDDSRYDFGTGPELFFNEGKFETLLYQSNDFKFTNQPQIPGAVFDALGNLIGGGDGGFGGLLGGLDLETIVNNQDGYVHVADRFTIYDSETNLPIVKGVLKQKSVSPHKPKFM